MNKATETIDARPGHARPGHARPGPGQRFMQWVQEPLGSIITASVATIGSLGLVLSGIWFVNLAIT